MEEGRSAFKILTGKPTGTRTLRWKNRLILELIVNLLMQGIGLVRLRTGIIGDPF